MERARDWQKERKKVPSSQRGKKKRTSKTCGAVRAQRENNLRNTQIHMGVCAHARTHTHKTVIKAAALFFYAFIFPLGKLTEFQNSEHLAYEKLNCDKRFVLHKNKRKSIVFPFALMDTLFPSQPFSCAPPSIHIPTALSLSLSDRWVGNEFRLSPSNRLGTKNCLSRQKCPFNLAKR